MVLLPRKNDSAPGNPMLTRISMIIELNDDDTRLLYAVLLQQAQEHFSYASTSEVAERLCKLATRFKRSLDNET